MGGVVPDIVIHTLRPSTKVCLTNLAHCLIFLRGRKYIHSWNPSAIYS